MFIYISGSVNARKPRYPVRNVSVAVATVDQTYNNLDQIIEGLTACRVHGHLAVQY